MSAFRAPVVQMMRNAAIREDLRHSVGGPTVLPRATAGHEVDVATRVLVEKPDSAPLTLDLAATLTNWSYFAKCVHMIATHVPSSQPTLWRTCRVLANRKRLQMLALLIRQPNQTVSAVAGRMRLSMPATSQYLRGLEARGLLTCRRVGRRVEYQPAAGTSEGAAGEIVKALSKVFRRAQPIEAIFKLATAFTHPRRIEVFRALANGADSFAKLQAATHIPARALSRHLTKLEARGFVKNEMARYVATIPRHPLGRVLTRLARC